MVKLRYSGTTIRARFSSSRPAGCVPTRATGKRGSPLRTAFRASSTRSPPRPESPVFATLTIWDKRYAGELFQSPFEHSATIGVKTRLASLKTIGDRGPIRNELVAEAEDVRPAGTTLCKAAVFRLSHRCRHDEERCKYRPSQDRGFWHAPSVHRSLLSSSTIACWVNR
jgi:hypothetical protein